MINLSSFQVANTVQAPGCSMTRLKEGKQVFFLSLFPSNLSIRPCARLKMEIFYPFANQSKLGETMKETPTQIKCQTTCAPPASALLTQYLR